jgi:hypothetical protein
MLAYEPSKPSSLTSTEGGFTPTISMVSLGEKLGTDQSVVMLWIGSRVFFSREQWLCPPLLMTSRKVVIHEPREIRMVDDHTRTERGKRVACWSDFPIEGMHRFESPRLLDMSTAYL